MFFHTRREGVSETWWNIGILYFYLWFFLGQAMLQIWTNLVHILWYSQKMSYNPFRNNVVHLPWTKSRGRNKSYLEALYIVVQLHMVWLQDVSYGGFQFLYVQATKNIHVNISSIGRTDVYVYQYSTPYMEENGRPLKGNVVFFFLFLTKHP